MPASLFCFKRLRAKIKLYYDSRTYYEQLNGYDYLKSLNIGYYFYSGRYLDAINEVLDPSLKTIVHIPNVNSRESTKDKVKEVNEIMDALGSWEGEDPATGFHRVRLPDGLTLPPGFIQF